jgi:hypothetical protein
VDQLTHSHLNHRQADRPLHLSADDVGFKIELDDAAAGDIAPVSYEKIEGRLEELDGQFVLLSKVGEFRVRAHLVKLDEYLGHRVAMTGIRAQHVVPIVDLEDNIQSNDEFLLSGISTVL